METNSPSTIVVNTPKGKTDPLTILIGVVATGAGLYLGNEYLKKLKSNKEAGNLDKLEDQIASKIYNAHHIWNDSEQVVFDAAREIAEKKLDWKVISKAFSNLYHENIDDFLNFLDAAEKTKFFQIMNLSSAAGPGKPPANSTLKYDIIKNVCVAIAAKGTNIRKSPAVIDNGGLFPGNFTAKTNIVGVAAINKVIGLLTGEYKLSPDGATGFVEILAPVWYSASKVSIKKVWVAGANLRIVQYDRNNPKQSAKAYDSVKVKNADVIRIDGSKYDSANS